MSIHLTMNRALQVITTFHQKKIQKMDHTHPENKCGIRILELRFC